MSTVTRINLIYICFAHVPGTTDVKSKSQTLLEDIRMIMFTHQDGSLLGFSYHSSVFSFAFFGLFIEGMNQRTHTYVCIPVSTAQGGSGSFKDRKSIGEARCCAV